VAYSAGTVLAVGQGLPVAVKRRQQRGASRPWVKSGDVAKASRLVNRRAARPELGTGRTSLKARFHWTLVGAVSEIVAVCSQSLRQ